MNINTIKEGAKNKFGRVTRMQIITTVFIIVIIAIVVIFVLGFIYLNKINTQISTLSISLSNLENNFSSTTDTLKENIAMNHDALSLALNLEKENVGNIEQKLGVYRQEIGTVSSTVNTLQKLSKTDSELLVKYSKVFFLNENYAPAKLTEIPNQYKYSDSKILKIQSQVWPYLQKMLDESTKAGITTYVSSAYRSFNEQKALKGQYSVVYGAGSANQFSADQGYSEHQLGTTVDLITSGLGGELEGFDKTKSYTWLLANAHKYGFVLSYPENNKFYVYEPWHWRFVGVKLATDLYNQKKSFYDLDQREIDEYLVSVFD
jgi:LAS superfamily LD-carboxypeptidase LdcB